MSATGNGPTALTTDELARVAVLMRDCGVAVEPVLGATLIAGGRSNLTYRLDDGRSQWVLRTPPRVGRTPSAHDVAREFRVTAAIFAADVPVPRPVLLCEDDAVLGGPFAVAGFVEGQALRTQRDLDELDDTQLDAVVSSMVSALVALHRVDHRAVGLETFGRPDAYAARQLRRWGSQWDLVGLPEHRQAAAGIIEALGASVPSQTRTSIVHGDFRVDNTLIAPDDEGRPSVVAVVDWELSTIGDPVADVAMMCAYRNPVFDQIAGEPSAWTSRRLPEPTALAEQYEAVGGRSLEHWHFHLALAYFKVAVIAAGIDHRHRLGASSGAGFESAGRSVGPYLELARTTLTSH